MKFTITIDDNDLQAAYDGVEPQGFVAAFDTDEDKAEAIKTFLISKLQHEAKDVVVKEAEKTAKEALDNTELDIN